jgi:pyridine nucleotide-disulfide oxidoreductase
MFGEPMAFWERNMPVGMLLRSTRRSSSISDPQRAFTLAMYERATGVPLPHPLTLDRFVAYGHWFRRQVAPDLDRRRVVRIESEAGGFRLVLDDEESVHVRRVVIAAGVAPFAWYPEQFSGLPPSLITHAYMVRDLRAFAGTRVLVVGAGQSALEYAALLYEAGAEVEIVARKPGIRWIPIDPGNEARFQRWLRRLMYPPTEVGPPGLSWIAAAPDIYRHMPRIVQPEIGMRCTLPAGAAWVRPRLADVTISTERTVTSAAVADGRLRITFDNGTRKEFDHALVATGYRVDVSRYEFITPELLRSLRLIDGYPRLAAGLETSVPGLHFLGAPAAASFGPVMRFVVGSWYAAGALTRKIVGKPPAPLSFSF